MALAESQKPFSIILATYNCGKKVDATIRSILLQNKNLFELIVVDGASTDDTLEYVKKYADNLTLISEKDGGVYEAYNKGIDLAAGAYLYFIGAGDCLREGVLQEVCNYVSAPNAADLIYGDAFVVNEQFHYGGAFDRTRLRTENLCHQTVFYKRRVFELLGKYECKYKIFADWVLNLRCFGDWRIVKKYISHHIVNFEGGGLSSNVKDAHFEADFSRLNKKYLGGRAYIADKIPVFVASFYWKLHNVFRQ